MSLWVRRVRGESTSGIRQTPPVCTWIEGQWCVADAAQQATLGARRGMDGGARARAELAALVGGWRVIINELTSAEAISWHVKPHWPNNRRHIRFVIRARKHKTLSFSSVLFYHLWWWWLDSNLSKRHFQHIWLYSLYAGYSVLINSALQPCVIVPSLEKSDAWVAIITFL